MARKLKTMRAFALIAIVGGAATVLAALAATPASAAEERLHSETLSTYGLIPPASIAFSGSSTSDSHSTSVARETTTVSFSAPKGKGGKNDGPAIEDPPLPGYDGNAPSAAHASISN